MIRGIIYLYTSPSGKHYVGQTINEKRRRKLWFSASYNYAGDKINRARNKYGRDSFKYEVLYTREFSNIQQAINALNTVEFFYVNLYNSIKEGYNCKPGGNAKWEYHAEKKYTPVVQLTKYGEYIQEFCSIKEAQSTIPNKTSNITAVCRGLRIKAGGYMWIYKEDYEKYFLHPETDMPQRVESKLKYIEQLNKPKQQIVEKKERYKYTEEDKKRMAESRKKTKRSSGKLTKVGQYDKDLKLVKVWSCAGEAAERLGCIDRNILRACKTLGTCMGFYWRIYEGFNIIQKKPKLHKDGSYLYKPVVQKNDNNEVLAIFNSVTDAAHSVGVNYNSCISACLKGKIPHAHGFIWEYYKQ